MSAVVDRLGVDPKELIDEVLKAYPEKSAKRNNFVQHTLYEVIRSMLLINLKIKFLK